MSCVPSERDRPVPQRRRAPARQAIAVGVSCDGCAEGAAAVDGRDRPVERGAVVGEGVLAGADQRADVERHAEAARAAELLVDDDLGADRDLAFAEELACASPDRHVDRGEERRGRPDTSRC